VRSSERRRARGRTARSPQKSCAPPRWATRAGPPQGTAAAAVTGSCPWQWQPCPLWPPRRPRVWRRWRSSAHAAPLGPRAASAAAPHARAPGCLIVKRAGEWLVGMRAWLSRVRNNVVHSPVDIKLEGEGAFRRRHLHLKWARCKAIRASKTAAGPLLAPSYIGEVFQLAVREERLALGVGRSLAPRRTPGASPRRHLALIYFVLDVFWAGVRHR
jgi:hypothetical protein